MHSIVRKSFADHRGSDGRWWMIFWSKVCMEMRLIKCRKKTFSRSILPMFSWIFESSIKSSARRRYFEFRVYSVNMNSASLRYLSMRKRSCSCMLFARSITDQRKICTGLFVTYGRGRWRSVSIEWTQWNRSHEERDLWQSIETRRIDCHRRKSPSHLQERKEIFDLWVRRRHETDVDREISSFQRRWAGRWSTTIDRSTGIDRAPEVLWRMEPDTTNGSIPREWKMLFHRFYHHWWHLKREREAPIYLWRRRKERKILPNEECISSELMEWCKPLESNEELKECCCWGWNIRDQSGDETLRRGEIGQQKDLGSNEGASCRQAAVQWASLTCWWVNFERQMVWSLVVTRLHTQQLLGVSNTAFENVLQMRAEQEEDATASLV